MTDSLFDYRTRSKIYRLGFYGSVAVIAFVGMFPLYWMAQTAFKSRAAIAEGISFYPTVETFSLQNFDILLSDQMSIWILNSVIVTTGTVAVTVLVSLVAGYGLARIDFSGKITFARVLLLGYMFSPIVLAVPLYLIWRQMGLINTRIGLIIALSAVSMPFSVWLMWKYIQTIPESMEETAWVEGASRWRGFVDVILPQTKPAIVANSLFAFAVAWNDFTFAQVLLPSNDAMTFPPGILFLSQTTELATAHGNIMAAGLLMTVPPMLFAYFLQSYLLRGFQIRSL